MNLLIPQVEFIKFFYELIPKLKELFEKEAPVVDIEVKKNFQQQYCFAFIEFSTWDDACFVKEKLKDLVLDKRKIKIEFQRLNPREKNYQNNFEQRPRKIEKSHEKYRSDDKHNSRSKHKK